MDYLFELAMSCVIGMVWCGLFITAELWRENKGGKQ